MKKLLLISVLFLAPFLFAQPSNIPVACTVGPLAGYCLAPGWQGGATGLLGDQLAADITNLFPGISGGPYLPLAGGTMTGSINMASGTVVGWNGGFGGITDTGISRLGVASLAIGNGTAGDASGKLSVSSVVTTSDSTFNGVLVGRGTGAVSTNTAVGYEALFNDTTGSTNTAVGYEALLNNTTGPINTAVGYKALLNDITGSGNVAVGSNALSAGNSGSYNTAIGYFALNNTTGQFNAAFGENAGGNASSSGSYNVLVGESAAASETSASNNVAIGASAIGSVTTGGNNVAIGYLAGNTGTNNIVGGSGNTIIGFEAIVGGASDTNEIVIGENVTGAGSNTTTIGNSSTTSTVLNGTVNAPKYATATNCSSSASPAVCVAAAAGSVALPTGTNPTLVVNTTAVTANSQIFLNVDEGLGTKLSVTCNTTLSTLLTPVVTARTAGTSFTFTIGAVIATNPACVSYFIIN